MEVKKYILNNNEALAKILDRLRAGDDGAKNDIFTRETMNYYKIHAKKYASNNNDLKELIQDAVTLVDYRLYKYDNKKSSSGTYLKACIKFSIKDAVKERNRKEKTGDFKIVSLEDIAENDYQYHETIPSHYQAPDDIVINKEKKFFVNQAAMKLKPKYKRIVELSFQGFRAREIATLMNMSIENVYITMGKIEKKMKPMLEDYMKD